MQISVLRYLPRPQWRWLHWLWRIPLLLTLLIILLLLVFRFAPVTTSSFMIQQQIAARFDDNVAPVRQQWVDYEEISPHLSLAVVASEDQLFPKHHGIDIASTKQAIRAALKGRNAGGGSTITQQVAKNLFLWSGRSYVRKGLEWGLALLIEVLWDKQRILEVYLNIAQFSERNYGVAAAAQNLLRKKPKKLRRHEAALLAAVLPSPERYSVKKPSRVVKKRQRHILKQMRQLGGASYLAGLSE
ncbi:MAG: monofunctional biosynthetic peptidoglycan transglycosylase [Thiolinea sp.]